MEATIANFRKSRHVTKGNQLVLYVDGVTSKDAARGLVGKNVVYNTGKKDIRGKITSTHGNKGAVRALFETGMPGQCLGKKVKIS
jgi:large subunit ribosomal protein L35Ae